MDPHNPQFRAFCKAQLSLAKINQEYREAFTDEEGMQLFLTAVTHPTADPKNNYQELEYIGDGIIKGILSQYIPRRFPHLVGEGLLSKTRRFLEQRKTLSDFALKLGFWDFVRADEETKTKLRKETLEDVFEAFVGALTELVDTRVKRGLGYNYAYNYVVESLNTLEIELTKETLDDPITRLNELYKAKELTSSKPPLKWGDAVYSTVQILVPKLTVSPSNSKFGQAYFSMQDKLVYIFDGKEWVHVSKMPLVSISAFPSKIILDEQGNPTNMQMLWYAGVYGFPAQIGVKKSKAVVPPEGTGETEEDPHTAKLLESLPLQVEKQYKINSAEFRNMLKTFLGPSKGPEIQNGEIIGQGLHFKKIDAKKMAALQALKYLKSMGFEK